MPHIIEYSNKVLGVHNMDNILARYGLTAEDFNTDEYIVSGSATLEVFNPEFKCSDLDIYTFNDHISLIDKLISLGYAKQDGPVYMIGVNQDAQLDKYVLDVIKHVYTYSRNDSIIQIMVLNKHNSPTFKLPNDLMNSIDCINIIDLINHIDYIYDFSVCTNFLYKGQVIALYPIDVKEKNIYINMLRTTNRDRVYKYLSRGYTFSYNLSNMLANRLIYQCGVRIRRNEWKLLTPKMQEQYTFDLN